VGPKSADILISPIQYQLSFLLSPVPLPLMHPPCLTRFGLQVGKKAPFQITCTCREIWVVGEGRGLSLNGDSPVLDIQPVPAHRSTCFRSATQGIRIDSPGVYFFSRINMRYYLEKYSKLPLTLQASTLTLI
jgi:hypothetical protein